MAERRKILIPTGAEDDVSLETPHFDTEAAKAARPVVPLSAEGGDLGPLPQSVHYTQSEPVSRSKVSPWLLSLIILAAMSAGAAGALALDYYRNHKHMEAQENVIQTTTATVATDARVAAPEVGSAVEKRVEPAPVPAPTASPAKAEPSPSPAEIEKSVEDKPKTKSSATTAVEHSTSRKSDEEQPVVKRERQRETADAPRPEDPDGIRGKRQRHPRDVEVRPEDLPPQIRRAGQELHRIREIFEGTRP
jgi:hypothetical protein